MDEQYDYNECEDEKFLIGNLLSDDDTYSPTKDVRNIQRNSTLQSSFNPSTTATWPEYVCQPPPVEWNPLTAQNGMDWTRFTPNLPNNYQESDQSIRYTPLSLSFGTNFVQPKPTATVPPFQTLNDLNKSDDTSSPVSDERASDSGTISPDSRPKQIKWKKLDLASIDTAPKVETYARQSVDSIQHHNGKSYSAVTQVKVGQQHKRLSATSSVPISKPPTQKTPSNASKKPTNNHRAGTQPVTPEEPPKPSKIVGLNPIHNSNSTYVSEPQKVHPPVTSVTTNLATTVPDFQKIKRKKKGKTNSKKADEKYEQKSGSRYLALIHSDNTSNIIFTVIIWIYNCFF
jgi:hypothetical protein